MIGFKNADDGRDEAYLLGWSLAASGPVQWLMDNDIDSRRVFDLSVQFKRRGKHLSHVKAQGTLIYDIERLDQLSKASSSWCFRNSPILVLISQSTDYSFTSTFLFVLRCYLSRRYDILRPAMSRRWRSRVQNWDPQSQAADMDETVA